MIQEEKHLNPLDDDSSEDEPELVSPFYYKVRLYYYVFTFFEN